MSVAQRKRYVIGAAVVALLVGGAPTAVADSIHPGGLYISTGGDCPAPAVDPDTRIGRIRTATTYLRSLVTHDTSELRVAPTVVRTEQGAVTAEDAKALCDGNQGPVTIEDAVLGMREIRWVVVDRDEAIAFYLLDSPTSPTYIAERFKVDHGLIQFIEAIFYIDVPGLAVGPESVASRPEGQTSRLFNSDHGPAGFFAPANNVGDTSPPSPGSRTAAVNAANAYVHALVAHSAKALPLASDAVRVENRRLHGKSAVGIRAAINGPGNRVRSIRQVHIYVEGDTAVATYELKGVTDAVGTGFVLGSDSVWAATRLRVQHGLITEIESICSDSAYCGTTK